MDALKISILPARYLKGLRIAFVVILKAGICNGGAFTMFLKMAVSLEPQLDLRGAVDNVFGALGVESTPANTDPKKFVMPDLICKVGGRNSEGQDAHFKLSRALTRDEADIAKANLAQSGITVLGLNFNDVSVRDEVSQRFGADAARVIDLLADKYPLTKMKIFSGQLLVFPESPEISMNFSSKDEATFPYEDAFGHQMFLVVQPSLNNVTLVCMFVSAEQLNSLQGVLALVQLQAPDKVGNN